MKRNIIKGKKGVSFIEVLIALAILGIIAVGFLSALSVTGNSVAMTDERATAESLVRSQIENIRYQPYVMAGADLEGEYPKIDMSNYPNYEIKSVNSSTSEVLGDLSDEIIGVPWDSETNDAASSDLNLQRIKLVILHNGSQIMTLESYKTRR